MFGKISFESIKALNKHILIIVSLFNQNIYENIVVTFTIVTHSLYI